MNNILQNKYIFRLTHKDNLERILADGLVCKMHSDFSYINIGDTTLIQQRSKIAVINPPGGFWEDFIPFYFAGHSPMLLNIKTGYRGIQKRDQSEIVYIVCKISDIIECCPNWFFTDGHGKNSLTKSYNDINNLNKLDWGAINATIWKNTPEDNDRMRRKQAEFLVKDFVPAECICGVIVKDIATKEYTESLLPENKSIIVHVDKENKYYYE